MKKQNKNTVSNDVPVSSVDTQYDYNVTSLKSFSIYNTEGGALYRGEVEAIAKQLRAEIFGVETSVNYEVPETQEQPAEEVKSKKGSKVYDKKRVFFFVLTMLFSLAIIAVAVISLFINDIDAYISIYNYKESVIVMLDPIFSFLSSTFGITISGMPMLIKESFTAGADIASVIASYALPIATVIYLVCTLAIFIASIVGMAKGKKDGYYKKVKLGFASIVCILCALIMGVSMMIVGGVGFDSILDFVIGKSELSVGYGWYGLVGLPVLTIICSLLTYRRAK